MSVVQGLLATSRRKATTSGLCDCQRRRASTSNKKKKGGASNVPTSKVLALPLHEAALTLKVSLSNRLDLDPRLKAYGMIGNESNFNSMGSIRTDDQYPSQHIPELERCQRSHLSSL